MSNETATRTYGLRPHEEASLKGYFDQDDGSLFVANSALRAPFFRYLHPLIAQETFYRDVTDLVHTLHKLQTDPSDPLSFAIREIPDPHFDTWDRINHLATDAQAKAFLQTAGNDVFIHSSEIGSAMRGYVPDVARMSFKARDPNGIENDRRFGIPVFVQVNQDGFINGFVDCYGSFNPNQPFPHKKMQKRCEDLRGILDSTSAREAVLGAVRQIYIAQNRAVVPQFAPEITTKAILVRSNNPVTVMFLRAAYDDAKAAGFSHTRMTTYLTFRRIAGGFNPETAANWRDFYPATPRY